MFSASVAHAWTGLGTEPLPGTAAGRGVVGSWGRGHGPGGELLGLAEAGDVADLGDEHPGHL